MSYVAYGLPSIYNDPGIFVASEGTRTATISSDGIVRIWEEREDQLLLINEIECIEMKDPVGCVWIDDDILVVASEELAIGICASDGTIAYEIETNDAAVSLTSVGSLFALSFRDGVIAVIEGQDGTLLWRNRLRFFSSKRIPVLKASDRAVLVPTKSSTREKEGGAMLGLILEDGSAILCRLDLPLCVVLHTPNSKADRFACCISMTSQETCGTFSGIVHHVHVAIGCLSGDIYLYSKNFHDNDDDDDDDISVSSWTLLRTLTLKHWYYTSEYVGSVTCLRWSRDTRVLAAGYARRGLIVWSKDGCRLVRTIPDVRGKDEDEGEDKETGKSSELFRSGIDMLEWGAESQRLIILTNRRKLVIIPIFRQIPCSYLRDQHVVASIGSFLGSSHVLLLSHKGTRRRLIRPEGTYLRDNYPLRVASVSQSGERVAVAGSRGFTIWSRRSSKWIMFGSRVQEQMLICDAMCWWNDVILIVAVRTTDGNDDDEVDDTRHELMAFPYWQLNKDGHTIMEPVSIPSSSSSSSTHGIRISCNENAIVVSCTNEIVSFTVTSHGTENWGYKCKNRLTLTPKFVVCGAYAHISQILSNKRKVTTTTKTLWYRRGSSNRIISSEFNISSPQEENEDTNNLKSRRALVRRCSTTSTNTNYILVDDGLSSFDLRWPTKQDKFDSLWSFGNGNIVLRSLGSRNDLESCRSYVKTDEWPLAMSLPTYETHLVVPVIGKESFNFRVRSRSCLHVVLHTLLSSGDESNIKDAVELVRCVLSCSEKNVVVSALTNVICQAAKSRNRNMLSLVRSVLSALGCLDSYDALVTSAAYQSDSEEWPFLSITENFLKRMLSNSITKSDSLFCDRMKVAVKCLAILKRLRFSSSDETKNRANALRLHHSNNMSLLVAAFSAGNVIVATETWNVLSRIELECASLQKSEEKILVSVAADYVSSQIADNLQLCSKDSLMKNDVCLVTMWISCARVPLSFLVRNEWHEKKKMKQNIVLRNVEHVYSRLCRLCRIVSRVVVDKNLLASIVTVLELSQNLQLALLCAIVLRSSKHVARYENDYPLMSRELIRAVDGEMTSEKMDSYSL